MKKLSRKSDEDVETYEEYDTIPDEDLDIKPEWEKCRMFLKGNLENWIKPNKKFKKFPMVRGQTRGSSSLFNLDRK